jgi:endonuclease III
MRDINPFCVQIALDTHVTRLKNGTLLVEVFKEEQADTVRMDMRPSIHPEEL